MFFVIIIIIDDINAVPLMPIMSTINSKRYTRVKILHKFKLFDVTSLNLCYIKCVEAIFIVVIVIRLFFVYAGSTLFHILRNEYKNILVNGSFSGVIVFYPF